MTKRIRRFALLTAFVFLVVACAPRLDRVSPSITAPVDREPAPAAAFVTAFTRGDEVAAEHVASPLYRAAWNRLGLRPDQRYAWHSQASQVDPSGRWLRLKYVGGITGASGRHHLLYSGLSGSAEGTPTRSVWRFDTDPQGRVIWGEMVYLFTDATDEPTVVRGTSASQGLARTVLQTYHPLVVVGVQTGPSHEGYFALIQSDARVSNRPDAPRSISVAFLAVDSDGIVRPGVWNYQG